MKSVSISFEYEENEYINADRRYLSVSGQVSKVRIITLAALAALCLLCAYTIEQIAIVSFVCFVIIVLSLMKMTYRYFIKPKSNFNSKQKNAKSYSFTFTKDKISLTTQRASADFQWKMFKKLYETSDMIYLAHANKSFTIIPKRAFENEEQLAAFRKIVGQGNSTMEYVKID
ncbi:MAG: YcxB family protein [Clostridia bacterium]|nr:YcxB family protein [Clostridia bacterium]